MAHAYFPFYPGDFLAGVQGFTKPQRGDYITLLCYQWANGQIPADEDELQMVCGGPVHQKVLAKFPGGINARLEKERGKADQKSAGAIEANRVRWEKVRSQQDSERSPSGLRTDSERIKIGSNADIQQEQEQESKQEQKQVSPVKPGKKVRTKIEDFPEDFQKAWAVCHPKSKERSGTADAFKAWESSGASKEPEKAIAAIAAISKSHDWTKDGAQYAKGLGAWLKTGAWMEAATDGQTLIPETPAYGRKLNFEEMRKRND